MCCSVAYSTVPRMCMRWATGPCTEVTLSNTGNRLNTVQAIHVRKHLDLRLFFVCFLPICVSAVVGGQLLVTFVSLKGQSTMSVYDVESYVGSASYAHTLGLHVTFNSQSSVCKEDVFFSSSRFVDGIRLYVLWVKRSIRA
jgi:hypothetical protein